MGMTLGLGLIGTGRHGARYAEHIQSDVPDAALVAVSRRDEEQLGEFAARYKVPNIYTDYRELVSDPMVDAVVIVTPNYLHMPMTVAAAENGKHVLVEKPMARNVEEARAMIDAARSAGVKLMVSHNFRYHPMVRRVKASLPALGKPYLITMCKRQQPAPGWREDPVASGGGALMDLGVHLFDQARFLLERDVLGLYCSTMRVASAGVEDAFVAVLDFPECAVTCDGSMASGSRADLIQIATDGGQLLADRYGRRITFIHGQDRRDDAITEPDFTIGLVLKDFVGCILENREPGVTGEDGLKAVEIAAACYRSDAMGQRVTLH